MITDTEQTTKQQQQQLIGANFPMTEEGRTYHVGVKSGEVANRIVCVGDLGRAQLYADLYLDKQHPVFRYKSSRGFLTLTGIYNGVPVSIIGTGMGTAMIDFTIREVRAVLHGDMVMLRTGTCGTLRTDVAPGNIVVNQGAVMIRRNPDAFRNGSKQEGGVVEEVNEQNGGDGDDLASPAYDISMPVMANPELTALLEKYMIDAVGEDQVLVGLDATADSFYSSQGRIDSAFDDRNEDLFDIAQRKYPELTTLEMETFHLFDMAQCCRKNKFYAASALLVLAQRRTDLFIDLDLKHIRERQAGKASLDAVSSFKLDEEETNGVWNTKQ